MAAQARARGAEIDDEAPGAAGDILFGYRGERPAGRAELLANSAIRARIFAGSIQTRHNNFDTTPNSGGIPAKFGQNFGKFSTKSAKSSKMRAAG